MSLPNIRMDFHSHSLGNRWTPEDLRHQGIVLTAGMRAIFYHCDAEDSQEGLLHTAGTIRWDADSHVFWIDLRTVDYRCTPVHAPALLDQGYPDHGSHLP